MKLFTTALLLTLCTFNAIGNPVSSTYSLAVSSTESSVPPVEKEQDAKQSTSPQIYKMRVTSRVTNRFAHTTVLSKVRNAAEKPQEATFSIILPEQAFISGFVMKINGKNYTAYVKEKEEAKRTYNQAVASGQSAAHVAVSARDSNRFTVCVNIEPQTTAVFYLSYEELLQRQDNHYDLIVNLHPGQPVEDLSVEVTINETRKITNLITPPLRSGNEIINNKSELDPRVEIKIIDNNYAVITFTPSTAKQKQIAKLLGTQEENGFSGQFVVQYDVERDPSGGEVLIQDGYFVHFFAPSELKPIPKHVVFILDTSSSMYGQKIVQLREAMLKILEQLNEEDEFHLVEFNTNVKVWDLLQNDKSVWYPTNNDEYSWSQSSNVNDFGFMNITFPAAYQASPDNIKKAKEAVSTLTPNAATDIYTALTIGLHLVKLAHNKESRHQPMIVFLTDGDPTVRLTITETIITKITEYNSGTQKAILFTLSFGEDANKNFLKKIAARNSGFSRHIYEASDAALQLQNFYKQISSPLLTNITFTYESSTISLTETKFPLYCGGSEIVVAGFCGTDDLVPSSIDGWGDQGRVSFKPTVERSVTSLERLWAYLTVKQYLEQKETSDKEQDDLNKKALGIALKYEFVTLITSLVVVKPNETSHVEPKSASKSDDTDDFVDRGYSYGAAAPSNAFSSKHALYYQSASFAEEEDADVDAENSNRNLYAAPPSLMPLTPLDALTSAISWLSNILKDGILSLTKGNFKLGLNETINDVVSCPKTLLNATGHCKLLNECVQVYPLLTSKDIFEEYFCILKNEYAGVCCPDIF